MANYYCKRIIREHDDGRLPDLCMRGFDKITGNPLGWCDECRKRLPIWPANDPPAAPVTLPADHLEPG